MRTNEPLFSWDDLVFGAVLAGVAWAALALLRHVL